MKRLALLMTALLVTTLGFASTTTLTNTQRSIAAAWRAKSSTGIALNHDINIVYGGQDVSPRHELASSTAFA